MDTSDHPIEHTLSIPSDLKTGSNALWGIGLAIVLALLPIYAFSSGGFQIVDIPLFIMIVVYFLSGANYKDSYIRKYINYYIPFVIWATLINGIYMMFHFRLSYLFGTIPIVYAIFLMMVFYNIFTKLLKQKDIKYIYIGLAISVIFCFTVKGVNTESRAVLSFNDPNQLGYFAIFLLSYTILLLNYKAKNNIKNVMFSFIDILLIFIAHYFLLLSVSRSAIGAFIILDICLLKNLKKSGHIVKIFLAIMAMSIFVLIINPTFIQDRLATRQGAFKKKDMEDNLKTRYFLPFQHFGGLEIMVGEGDSYGKKMYPLLGLGEPVVHMEVHNIFGEVFRAFGLIGISLFLFWLVNMWQGVKKVKDSFWVLGGIITFNMAIYGIRWRGFWIFIALLMALAALENFQEKREDYTKS